MYFFTLTIHSFTIAKNMIFYTKGHPPPCAMTWSYVIQIYSMAHQLPSATNLRLTRSHVLLI
jgi:hypothetical protein